MFSGYLGSLILVVKRVSFVYMVCLSHKRICLPPGHDMSGEGKSTTPTVGEKILQSITHVFVSPLRECPSKEKHHMYMYGRPPPPRGALRWFGGGKKNTGGDHSCAMGQLWWVLGCLCGFSRVLLGRLGTRRVICGATCRVTWPFGDPKGH